MEARWVKRECGGLKGVSEAEDLQGAAIFNRQGTRSHDACNALPSDWESVKSKGDSGQARYRRPPEAIENRHSLIIAQKSPPYSRLTASSSFPPSASLAASQQTKNPKARMPTFSHSRKATGKAPPLC